METATPDPISIFGPDGDNVIAGEIVVSLEAAAATQVGVSIASMPTAEAAAPVGVTALGASGLDEVLAQLDVQSVARVHSPGPTEVVAGIAMAAGVSLDTTLRVRYGATEDPQEVAKALNAVSDVALG
jgi:hypothetical protein